MTSSFKTGSKCPARGDSRESTGTSITAPSLGVDRVHAPGCLLRPGTHLKPAGQAAHRGALRSVCKPEHHLAGLDAVMEVYRGTQPAADPTTARPPACTHPHVRRPAQCPLLCGRPEPLIRALLGLVALAAAQAVFKSSSDVLSRACGGGSAPNAGTMRPATSSHDVLCRPGILEIPGPTVGPAARNAASDRLLEELVERSFTTRTSSSSGLSFCDRTFMSCPILSGKPGGST